MGESIDGEGFSNLVISEIQTGGCSTYDSLESVTCLDEDGKTEFVEIYNPLSQEIDVTNWEIDYTSASGKTTTPLYVFDGKILPSSYVLLAHDGHYADLADAVFGVNDTKSSGMLARSGGHIQIKDDTGQIIDMVGWGSAVQIDFWPIVTEIPPGFSTKRIMPDDALFDTGIAFLAPTLPIDLAAGGYIINQQTGDGTGYGNQDGDNNSDNGDTDTGGMGGGDSQAQTSCDGIIISELLVNPGGSDSGHEFIELHNPTDKTISITGCKLQTTDSSKMYEFTDKEISPGEYLAFYNDLTGLTLTNSGGGKVFLVSPDESEDIYESDYPASLDDDVSWSLIDGKWAQTFSVTPGAKNKLLALKPCPAGEFRNPGTNRCNNIIEEAGGLAPCAPGKERNPDTHRCRNITSLSSTLKPCASDQFRNPATNRCKKLGSAGSTLKPCEPGQYRNPATNRCKKKASVAVSGTNQINDVKDVLSESTGADNSNWTIAAVGVFGALGYSIWEWRNEIMQFMSGLKKQFSS
ncbi:MAG TPA: lamin tail domain-containing protein [Candidatus Saccharimonadales bacterium]|nr:lamin tail domain-containing protein [Candidatus Saccharimonadales bacterium]